MSLSEQNGYAIYHSVLHPDECDELTAIVLNGSETSRRPGARGLLGNDVVQKVARDHRLTAIAKHFLHDSPIPFKATLFNKEPESNWSVVWHQDRVLPLEKRVESSGWGPWTIKDGVHFAQAPTWAMERVIALRVHLDDSTDANGPLKVVPGSHSFGVRDQKDVIAVATAERSTTLTTQKGGVVAMRPLLIHGSGKMTSGEPRRVLHIEYTDRLYLTDDIRIAFC